MCVLYIYCVYICAQKVRSSQSVFAKGDTPAYNSINMRYSTHLRQLLITPLVYIYAIMTIIIYHWASATSARSHSFRRTHTLYIYAGSSNNYCTLLVLLRGRVAKRERGCNRSLFSDTKAPRVERARGKGEEEYTPRAPRPLIVGNIIISWKSYC